MKLNLGCGTDIKPGYVNVDYRDLPGVNRVVDLSSFPWPWEDGSADEILLLDFLEHFPYVMTDQVLRECWRIMKPEGTISVQVPDFTECALAILRDEGMICNGCGWEWTAAHLMGNERVRCKQCNRHWDEVRDAAVHRLYGGQDYPGNFHYNTFTMELLQKTLKKNGLEVDLVPELNQNGETYRMNWTLYVRAKKSADLWGDE